MNIFLLDQDPTLAAQYHADVHVVKMVLETAQLLSTAFTKRAPPDVIREHVQPYKPTHLNHPCALWAAAEVRNAQYLCHIGIALATEYTYRYAKRHASTTLLERLQHYYAEQPSAEDPAIDWAKFPQCMPPEYQVLGAPVKAYRAYYAEVKRPLLRYARGRLAPAWLST